MGRRGRSAPKNRRPADQPGHNEYNRQTARSRQRARMLDAGRETFFRYDVDDVLKASPIQPERAPAIAASIVTKAVRLGVDDARVYIKEKGTEGVYDQDTQAKLLRLLDRYTILR